MTETRREFLKQALAMTATACYCPYLFAAQKPTQKVMPSSLILASAKVCGTCQHWKGSRTLIEKGKRVKCQQMASAPCFRGAGYKYAAVSSAASHGCITGGQYKRWSQLP